MADNKAFKDRADAQFRFAMSEDGMKLGVSRYFPPNGGEGPSVDLLKRQIAEAGVSLPVDDHAARQIIDAIQSDGEVRRIVLVRGIDVQEPQNARLAALGNLEFPVFPGDRFARKYEPVHPRNGETIDGHIKEPQENFTPEDIQIAMGENVEFDPLTESYVSQTWGMARFNEGTLSVDPLTHITEDSIAVVGTIHPKDFRSQSITPARIEKVLRDMGVVIDIDSDMLDEKTAKARELNTPLIETDLAAGQHPVPGRDGWFEYLVSSREEAGIEDESGRLNFKDRGTYPMVKPGQIIGRLQPPTAGEGGIDIYGKTIPAHAGKPVIVRPGEGVLVHEDKSTFEAKSHGVVVMAHHTLSVTECLLIPGNVDLATGNIKVERGSVKILGSIQAGFTVNAPKHVIVGGSIESANVYAGGNLEVAGGILMPDGGKIDVDGEVTANYTTNANITARGNVIISNDITNSIIKTEGILIGISGKGHIQGGQITTGKGVVVNEVGSDLGVQSSIGIVIQSEDDTELKMKREKVKEAIKKIDDTMGTDSPEAILRRTPREKRSAVAEVLKHRIALIKRRKSLSEQLTQLALRRQEQLAGIKIKVHKFIHPGTTITFGTKVFQVAARTEAATIYWSDRKRDIVFE